MSIFDFWKRKPAADAGDTSWQANGAQWVDLGDLSDPRLAEFVRGGAATGSGAIVTPDTAMRAAAVYGCVRILAGTVATVPFQIKKTVGDNVRQNARDHPLWNVFNRKPNRWQTPSEFRRMLQAHVLLRGNGFALIVKSGARVIELLPLDPGRMECKQDDTTLRLEYTYRRKDGRPVRLPQEDVFHLRGMTLDGVNGMSVLSYAREAVGLSLRAEQHGSSLFKHGVQVASALEHPSKLSPEAYERLQASLDDKRGAENANKNVILEEGLKFNNIGMTSEDAQFLQSRQFQRSDIAMFFGVPPHMIGDTEKTTSFGSGIEQQSIGFVTYTMEDWFTGWEETTNRDCLADSETDIYARFNRAALVRGDLKTRYEAYQIGRQGEWLSANDIRALEDLNPIEGGDVYLNPTIVQTPETEPENVT